jgi:hypothetical protein
MGIQPGMKSFASCTLPCFVQPMKLRFLVIDKYM